MSHIGRMVVLACAATLPGLAPLSAEANETGFCVDCTGPTQSYYCNVTHARGAPHATMKYECIMQMAKSGGHASCAVSRNSPSVCRGAATKVSIRFGNDTAPGSASSDQAEMPPAQAEPPVVLSPDAAPAADPSLGERPSVARMTKRAIRASRDGLSDLADRRPMRAAAQGAGERLGRFARCARRFFWKCRAEDNEAPAAAFAD